MDFSLMNLQKHLILNRFFLNIFGAASTGELLSSLSPTLDQQRNITPAFWERLYHHGKTYFSEEQFWNYQQAIETYQLRLQKTRRQPEFTLQYFQVLAILFSEIFLDWRYHQPERFIEELNRFLNAHQSMFKSPVSSFTISDLNKIAFWMATGSGKTLLMHIHYWQIQKYSPIRWDNILLITPNEGMSYQHHQELRLSGIQSVLYEGNKRQLAVNDNAVLVIDIHKLMEERSNRGVRIDVSAFEGQNLVFIDEGHKGQATEEKRWKTLRERLGESGMIIEYSATFGPVISKNPFLLEEYSKAILFDYSYQFFFADSYGKSFYTVNLKTNRYSSRQQEEVLLSSLLTFYLQLNQFYLHNDEVQEYYLEKPLWAFVGNRVTGEKLESDVLRVLLFFRELFEKREEVNQKIQNLLTSSEAPSSALSQFLNEMAGNLSITIPEVSSILQNIFKGQGQLEVYEILRAQGELGLKLSGSDEYFGVIQVGDLSALKRLLNKFQFSLKPDYFSDSLFRSINHLNSSINVLIGAKKFVEGWNSWRVSNMVLMNTGKGEGPQIIQLFGRGIRLKGRNFSLRRELSAPPHIQLLQTLYIFGLNADYLNSFLKAIVEEGISPEDVKGRKYSSQYEPPSRKEKSERKKSIRKVFVKAELMKDLIIDVRPRFFQLTSGKNVRIEPNLQSHQDNHCLPWELLDWDELFLQTLQLKGQLGLHHLIITPEVIHEIITSNQYTLKAFPHQLEITDIRDLNPLQQIALKIIKEYLIRFDQISQ
ncbi:MAG: hypothetical protein D6748_00780 [Calditrichaeota bacterium]|nr:MAG: hypothetical protein D6748_00780 [Calditrichota bacterium]